jgi:hypothetical protein
MFRKLEKIVKRLCEVQFQRGLIVGQLEYYNNVAVLDTGKREALLKKEMELCWEYHNLLELLQM